MNTILDQSYNLFSLRSFIKYFFYVQPTWRHYGWIKIHSKPNLAYKFLTLPDVAKHTYGKKNLCNRKRKRKKSFHLKLIDFKQIGMFIDRRTFVHILHLHTNEVYIRSIYIPCKIKITNSITAIYFLPELPDIYYTDTISHCTCMNEYKHDTYYS